ncbi:MAG: flagellar biosynthesis anti-sigma factor FlgM [Clostridiales bacterium]|nr:flagellar biosynthesis anti-sigma factor FlgM [Clostridiales bacterium]
MIDFPNVHNVTPIRRPGSGQYAVSDKKDPNPLETGKTDASDVVQISSDAAMKSKLGSFAATLAKEMQRVDRDRITQLKEQYAGESCPVNDEDIASAIVARIKIGGFENE